MLCNKRRFKWKPANNLFKLFVKNKRKSIESIIKQKILLISNKFSDKNLAKKSLTIYTAFLSSWKCSSELNRNIIKRMKMDSINELTYSPLESNS